MPKAKKTSTQLKPSDSLSKTQLINAVANNVQMKFIRLEEGNFTRTATAGSEPAAATIKIQMHGEYTEVKTGRFLLSYVIKFSVEVEPKAVVIAAVVRVGFDVNPKSSIVFNTEVIDAFGKSCAIFHAWPYWRELASSLTTRMGLPAMMVPLYRPGIATWDVAEDEPPRLPAATTRKRIK